MRAVDCQANKKDFPKPSENNTKKIFNTEQPENLRFDEERKTFNLDENSESLLKNKRHRDPQDLDIAKHSIIRNINSFLSEYIAFLNNPLYNQVTDKLKNQQDFEFINQNKYVFSHFYNIAKKYNSYGELIAYDVFNELAKQTDIFPNGKEARKVYDRYLFHFIELLKLEITIRDSADPAGVQRKMIDCLSYDPSYILEVPVIECNTDDKDEINKLIIEGLKHDLVILRGFLDKFGFNPEYFTEKFIVETYKDQKIEVIEQTPNFFGFTDNFHKRQNWTLSQLGRYLDYKRNNQKYLGPKSLEESANIKIDENKIYFGVNLDMDHMEIPREEIRKKINPLLNFCAFDDALSYMRETINGMNLPQFYIKENGVWTGGHEENCRIRSININHGPQGSEWYGIRLEDAKVFSEYLKKKHDVNIYLKEGLWYENWEYFLKNKLNVLFTVQKGGDIILVGPGCIHWVRSLGNAVHSSWNFFPKEKIQFETALERYKVNRSIKMRSLVPLYTLMIDILNFEMYYLDLDLVKYCYDILQEFFRLSNIQNSKLLNNLLYSRIPILKELEAQNVVVCENCLDEVFNFWIYAEKFTGIRKEKYDTIMCPSCFEKEFKYIDQNYSLFISYKYETQELKKLFSRVKKRMDIELGNVTCSGEIEDEFQISLAKFNKDTRFNAKIKAEFVRENKSDPKLTVFLNKKNTIFEKISAVKVFEHIQSNFTVLANHQKPMHNELNEQLESMGNQKLIDLLKGRKKTWAQKQNDKSNFAACEENNFTFKNEEEGEEEDKGLEGQKDLNGSLINYRKNKQDASNSENDSLFDFYDKTNLKLVEASIEDANLGAGSNKFFKVKSNLSNENLNKDDVTNHSFLHYNSKILIPKEFGEKSEIIENQIKQTYEADAKVTKEQSELTNLNLKENNDETISHSANPENNEEQEALSKSFEKANNLNALSNLFDKTGKEICDLFEVSLSNCEIDNNNYNNFDNICHSNVNNINIHSEHNNELSKYAVYKNNHSINIAKLSATELIKIINKNSKALNPNKNSDLRDNEFTFKNQRKKLRNNASSHKKSVPQSGLATLTASSSAANFKQNGNGLINHNTSEDNMIIPFDTDISVKSGENALQKGNQTEELNLIKEKIGDKLFLEIENWKYKKINQNLELLLIESEKYFDSSSEYDASMIYIHKNLINIKKKVRDRQPLEYLIKKIENKYKQK